MTVELIGRTIKAVRPLTKKELDAEGWSGHCTAIELDNDITIYASRDEEGNGPGCLFGKKGKNNFYVV